MIYMLDHIPVVYRQPEHLFCHKSSHRQFPILHWHIFLLPSCGVLVEPLINQISLWVHPKRAIIYNCWMQSVILYLIHTYNSNIRIMIRIIWSWTRAIVISNDILSSLLLTVAGRPNSTDYKCFLIAQMTITHGSLSSIITHFNCPSFDTSLSVRWTSL